MAMRVTINYVDDGDDDRMASTSASRSLPDEWKKCEQSLPQLFRATVGDLAKLFEYFPDTSVEKAIACVSHLATSCAWFGGAISDSLVAAMIAEAGVKVGPDTQAGFAYGDAPLSEVDPSPSGFAYGDETKFLQAPAFVVRFSRQAPHYTCVLSDPQRGIHKRSILREGEGRFRYQGRVFASLELVAQHLIGQGFVTVPACRWSESLSRVLDDAWCTWGSLSLAECKDDEERALLSLHCFYGKADDAHLAQQLHEAGNPAAYCIRYGSAAGTFTLCVCKPSQSGGSNAKFPHYFKYALKGTASQGVIVQGWKESPLPPATPLKVAELASWLHHSGYRPFSNGAGYWGRAPSRSAADPKGTGCVTLRQLTGSSNEALVWYGRPGDGLHELLREAAAEAQVPLLQQTLLSTLREVSGTTCRLIDHGPLVLVSVPTRLVWLRSLLQLVRSSIFFQEPLGSWNGSVCLVTRHGATLDVIPCLDSATLVLLDGSPLPALTDLPRSLLGPACILGSRRGLSRSRVFELLQSGARRDDWSQCVALLGGECSLQELGSALLDHQNRLCGLEARQAVFLNAFQHQLAKEDTSLESKKSQVSSPTSTCPVIPEERLRFEKLLGGGNFGQVWSAKLASRVPVAVKRLLNTDPAMEAEIVREAALLNQIRHPGVLQLLGVSRESSSGAFLIVMELMQSSLSSWLADRPCGAVVTRLCIARDVCVALAYCHLLGVLHRDVAARNVLLSGSDPVRVKLCDFGLGAECQNAAGPKDSDKRFPISVPWASPEALKYRFSAASDTWSYGVLVAEIFSSYGRIYEDWDKSISPFEPGCVPAFFSALKKGKRLSRPEMCPESLYQTILNCWSWEPSERCSLDVVVDVLDKEIGHSDGLDDVVGGPPSASPFAAYEGAYAAPSLI